MDDAEFLRQFEDRTLPFEQWNHRTHVKVAYLYLSRLPLDRAIDRIRVGIQRYNAANDVPEGPGMGYSETMTVAFMRIIHATMQAYGEMFPTATADEFCDTHPHLLHRSLLRVFYSPLGRQDLAAEKVRFVDPDMCPLPRYAPPVTVRRPDPAEAAALADMGGRLFADAHAGVLERDDIETMRRAYYAPARLETDLAQDDRLVLVADDGRQLCGYVRLCPGPAPAGVDDDAIELAQIYVEPEWIGRSVGSALLEEALRWAAGRGHRRCWLRVWTGNTGGIAFYSRRGFEQVVQETLEVGASRPTVLVMRKELAPPPPAS